MQRFDSTSLIHGAVGGIAAGAAVALWFFVVDLLAGAPFHTPVVLAGALLGQADIPASFRLVAGYTILHFGVFATVGVAVAAFLWAGGLAPRLIYGLLVGVGVLVGVHYGAMLITGATLAAALPTGHVLAANMLGGMVLMTYLHLVAKARSPFGPGALGGHPLLVQGLVTGVLGAGTVALWFLLLDVLGGRPFFTPAALGSLAFLGAASPADVQIAVGVVAAYTVLHVVAFVGVGVLLAWAVERIEQAPGFWLLALMAVIVLEGLFLGIAGSLGDWVLGAISWWAIGIGNVAAVASMGWWIWHSHPRLRLRLSGEALATKV